MTPEQLDEIEKLAGAATPGLWVAEQDAALIAAMRKYALPLVKALREARAHRMGEWAGWLAAKRVLRAALRASEAHCTEYANRYFAEANGATTPEARKLAKKAGKAWHRVAEAHQSVSVELERAMTAHEVAHEHPPDDQPEVAE